MNNFFDISSEFAEQVKNVVVAQFNDDELRALHSAAYTLYAQCLYDDAARYYWLLALHVPRNPLYLKGLGASQFMAKRISDAVTSYTALLVLDPYDPETLCMCGHALLLQGNSEEARPCLERATKMTDESSPFHSRAAALLALMSH